MLQWHCRAWGRAWSSGADGENLAAGCGSGWRRCSTALRRGGSTAGLPGAVRSARYAVGTTVHRGRAVDQTCWPGRPGRLGLRGTRCRPVPGTDEKTIGWSGPAGPASLTRALLGPRPRRRAAGRPGSVRRYVPARRPAGTGAGRDRLRAVAVDGKTSRGARRADGTRVISRRRRARRAPAGSPRGRHQAQRDQPLHRAPGTPGPGGRRGDLRCLHTVRANLDWLAGQKKAHYIAVVKKNQPLLHARVRACLAADTGRQHHPRDRARPYRDPHPESRPRRPPGLPVRPSGHQDHPPAEGHRHQQDHPRDRLRGHQLDQC